MNHVQYIIVLGKSRRYLKTQFYKLNQILAVFFVKDQVSEIKSFTGLP